MWKATKDRFMEISQKQEILLTQLQWLKDNSWFVRDLFYYQLGI